MASNVTKILVVLASPESQQDNRSQTINSLCKTFIDTSQKRGISVDLIDLYKDTDFNPIYYPSQQDTKVLEYQIRVRKADLIVFFHPIIWGLPPAIMKGFIDKVFTNGFVFNNPGKRSEYLLEDKEAVVICTSEKPAWEFRFLYRNLLDSFWKRAFFDACGIKSSIIHFGNIRSAKDSEISSWHQKISTLGDKVNSKESLLDLF